MLLRIALVFGVLVGCLSVSPASAQTDDERARAHFEAGTSYFNEGEYADALREFNRSYDLSHRPELLYNIALTHQFLGEPAEAARQLRAFLAAVQDVPNREALEHRVEALERQAAGGEVAETDTPEGEPAPVEAPSSASASPSSGTDLTVPAIISFAVGGAGLALFAVGGGLALDGYGALQRGCGATNACDDADVGDVRLYAGLADVGIAVAGVGVITGVVLLLVSGGGSSGEAATAHNLTVTPWASTSSAGVLVGGTL